MRACGMSHRREHDQTNGQGAVVRRLQQMSADPEEILYESVYREKPLRVCSGFEPTHLSLALPCRLM